MSRATELVSSPNRSVMASASCSSIPASASTGTACIASQNRRWSSAEAGILVNRSAVGGLPATRPAGPFHSRR